MARRGSQGYGSVRRAAVGAAAAAGVAVALAAGCTGLTPGENNPGDDTYLDDLNYPACEGETCRTTGSIAVDPRTENSLVMVGDWAYSAEDESWSLTGKRLASVPPDASGAEVVADLDGTRDVRVLFPTAGVLLMAEREGLDELRVLDPATYEETGRLETDARYHGTRLSPSGRFLAVADNIPASAPIHVIDTSTLETVEVPHDGEWLEAMWAETSDRLLAVVFYDMSTANARARLLSWTIERLGDLSPGPDGFWPSPDLDVTVPGASGDFFFSYTWVGISPDDRWAVFPVRRLVGPPDPVAPEKDLEWMYQLLVLDLQTAELRTVDDAQGPVGFTPDGSTIVSYRYEADQPQLLAIDAETLAVEVLEIPWQGLPQFFVTSLGNLVVVASTFGDQSLVLYDLDAGTARTLKGPALDLNEFVTRPIAAEMWLVDDGLFRVDLGAGSIETMSPGWVPGHINVLRGRDLLVLDDVAAPRLRFYSPDERTVTGTVDL